MPFLLAHGPRRKRSAPPPPSATPPRPGGPGGESGPSPHRSTFRPDIEGLRAVAVLAVLAFHAQIPGAAGGFVGVDVFFVVSGYLITGLLVREAITTGRIRLGDFFSRRARRLLPSAAVVLASVAVAGAWLTVPLLRADLEQDVLAAALSVANWRFVSQQTDYLAAGHDQSPLLHFWSLAVEEQFYLFWAPLLAVIVLVAARAVRRGRAVRAVVAVTTAAVALASFALSLHWTRDSVSLAYLGTPRGSGSSPSARCWRCCPGTCCAGPDRCGWSADGRGPRRSSGASCRTTRRPRTPDTRRSSPPWERPP